MESYRYVRDDLWVGVPTTLSTEDGEVLSLTPAKFIPYEFSFGIKQKGEEVDVVHSLVRLADEQGRLWEGESIWHVGDIVERMTHLGSIGPPVKFENAPREWKEAFTERLFFSGARALLDDRFHRRLLLEDEVFDVPFKYQGPTLDMAFHRTEHVGLVQVFARVGGLHASLPKKPDDVIELPQIVFQLEAMNHLFVNFGCVDSTGYYAYDIIPRPFIMKRTGLTGAPNPLVQYHEATGDHCCE